MNYLDIDAINLKAPYKVSLIDEKEYQFITEKGIIYRVGFIPDDSICSCEAFQFYISRETIHHSTKDLNVEPTIITILERFFEDNQSGELGSDPILTILIVVSFSIQTSSALSSRTARC